MFNENLLSVGTEDNTEVVAGQTGLTADQIFAGAESELRETEELNLGYDKLIATADEIEKSVVLDKAGLESKNVTPEYVIAQAENLETVLSLGINAEAPATIGTESIHADPMEALKVGVEAKEGLIKKIIRKAKDFIKMIIKKIQEFGKKLVTSASMLFTNMKGLKDKADELDGGYKFDKKEEKEVHNKFRDALGFYCSKDATANGALGKCIAAIGASYKESNASELEKVYEDFKSDKEVAKATLTADTKDTIDKLDAPSGPAGAAFRALKSDKEDVVAITTYTSPKGVQAISLKLKTKSKKETATLKTAALPAKVDAVVVTGDLKASDIQGLAKDALSAFDSYNAKDVITALYGRLNDMDKDISEVSKTGKSKSVTRIMKFVSFENARANAAIKAVIANQKGAYTAVKVLVDNAE